MQFTPSKIDWKAATSTKPPEILADVPPGIARKNMVRRTAMFKAAADVIPCIPAPGESFHCLLNGRYDFMVLLATILAQIGRPCLQLRMATLSYGRRNIDEICRLIDDGTVGRVVLLCGEVFREKCTREYGELRNKLAERSGGHILAAARAHAKVTCMEFGPDAKLVVEGSANLVNSHNIEQATLINDVPLHDWHTAWIDQWVENGRAKEDSREKQ